MESALAERIVVQIFRLNGLLTRTGNRLAQELGLTQQKWVLLAALRQQGECVLSQLGQSLLVTKANITGMVDRLERDGLVRRRRDQQDRRLWWVGLTRKGEAALEDMNQVQEEWFQSCFQDFKTPGMESLLEGLRQLSEAVQQTESFGSPPVEKVAEPSAPS